MFEALTEVGPEQVIRQKGVVQVNATVASYLARVGRKFLIPPELAISLAGKSIFFLVAR